MKISQPFVLLLGGLVSASSIGCSAVNALVRDDRPAAGSSQSAGSAERLVAIGRVFENQARYDQAEVMYRRALKKKPNDPAIQNQLAQLVEKRNGQKFGAGGVESAIAAADSVSGKNARSRTTTSNPALPEKTPNSPRVIAESSTSLIRTTAVSAQDDAEATVKAIAESVEDTVETTVADATADSEKAADAATAVAAEFAELLDDEVEQSGSDEAVEEMTAAVAEADTGLEGTEDQPDAVEPAAPKVTAEQIITAMSDPNAHVDVLLNGLTDGESSETQCLAATLLGECDPENQTVREALIEASKTACEPSLVMCIIDSQIQRGQSEPDSASRLIELLESGSPDVQAQAASGLRMFVGTDRQTDCIDALKEQLENESADVRALAALTLGDYGTADPEALTALRKLAEQDSDAEVREAAAAALGRNGTAQTERSPGMVITPKS